MPRSTLDRIKGSGMVAGGWLLQRVEPINPKIKDRTVKLFADIHAWAYRKTGGRLVSNIGAPTLLLTTTGRKTGQPRTTALFYLPDGDRQVLVGSYVGDVRHPQWYLNLSADPAVTVQIGTEVRRATARTLTGAEREAMWPRVVENWPGYRSYQSRTDRELPVVVLTRVDG